MRGRCRPGGCPWRPEERRGKIVVADQDEKPVLDERTFDKLLEAAHVLQEHNRKVRVLEARMEAHNQRLREQELAEQAPPPKSKPDAEPTANSSDYTLTLAEIVEAQRQIQVRYLALNKAVAVVAEKSLTSRERAVPPLEWSRKRKFVTWRGRAHRHYPWEAKCR